MFKKYFNKALNSKILMTTLLIFVMLFIIQYYINYLQPQKVSISSAPQGGDFSIHTQQGDLQLSQLKGQVVLLYFGFTSCPKVCPRMLSKISTAIKSLNPEQQKQLKVLFISVDPDRDSLEELQIYAKKFGDEFVGGTQDVPTLQGIVQLYGAYFAKMEMGSQTQNAKGHLHQYTMDHSTQVFVIDQQGVFKETIPESAEIEAIQLRLKSLLEPRG